MTEMYSGIPELSSYLSKFKDFTDIEKEFHNLKKYYHDQLKCNQIVYSFLEIRHKYVAQYTILKNRKDKIEKIMNNIKKSNL
jgi:hypothetical protein